MIARTDEDNARTERQPLRKGGPTVAEISNWANVYRCLTFARPRLRQRRGGSRRGRSLGLPAGRLPESLPALEIYRTFLQLLGCTLLVIELDGGRVYLADDGNLFTLPAHAAIRDRLVDAYHDRPR